ncbi:hypothetical protein CEUSTIGMA_g12522.t1 [Chlamydomonas eustigma]|uniref:Eukaryotic translation initiation factor 5A n=1 Tax=Chlamydomonas eustigma TaxID=1157962 RepID=A0A250XQ89_9CHLO|nr:hypothetical protein CEUSTIGMA_g12522.t1 [Chlamydomonas eustigma]|eukprot:GAX85102.1 hypothetical protein CEUSTIGMA_g12522.t1 [Chlamydomonas eustigma]
MSDLENETFEAGNAGAALTFPQQAGTIRKNAYVCLNNRPCKVADVSTSKTGKHGSAKCHFVAIDIFNGKKYEELSPSTANMDVPNVFRNEYTLIDINEEGFCSLMTESGDTRDDLMLPGGTDEYEKLAKQLKEDFAEGKEIVVTVLKAMDIEMISSLKIVQPTK